MSFHKNLESILHLVSVIFIVAVFSLSFYVEVTQKPQVWEVKVFETQKMESPARTLVFTYGKGYRVFDGSYNLTSGKTYKITFIDQSSGRGKIISIENTQ
jgi:hypothetical protein